MCNVQVSRSRTINDRKSYAWLHGCMSGCSHFGASSEELLPPLAADGLEAAHDIPALLAGLAIFQTPVPLAALDPARAFLAAFFLAPQVADEFACGA